MRALVGIDPGLDAYCCAFNPAKSAASGLRWQFFDVPTVGEDAKRRIDVVALRDWLRRVDPERVWIEEVGPMRGQGIAHTSRFLRAVGMLEAVVRCMDMPLVLVAPTRWKRHFEIKPPEARVIVSHFKGKRRERVGVTKADVKELSRQKVLGLHPELESWLANKSDHGRAEAALLALYGHHMLRLLE